MKLITLSQAAVLVTDASIEQSFDHGYAITHVGTISSARYEGRFVITADCGPTEMVSLSMSD